jgi:hypothetical protein
VKTNATRQADRDGGITYGMFSEAADYWGFDDDEDDGVG